MELSGCTLRMGGRVILERGAFRLDQETERALVAHMKGAELYASVAPPDGLTFRPPVMFPPHERAVEIEGAGDGPGGVHGARLGPQPRVHQRERGLPQLSAESILTGRIENSGVKEGPRAPG